MAESYADLTGGSGRSVYFRPRRYRPRTLLPQLPALRALRVAGYDLDIDIVCKFQYLLKL